MIAGIGVDITSVARFEGKERRFYERFLTPEELEAPLTAEYAASRFAAKEAFAKALGTGIRGFSLKDVSVAEDALGKPFFRLSGRAREKAGGLRFQLSLSHDGGFAVAFVVAEDEK